MMNLVLMAVMFKYSTAASTNKTDCSSVICSPLTTTEQDKQILEIGEKIIISRDECCPFLQIICDNTLCPKRPNGCNGAIATSKGKCCEIYECIGPNDKCVIKLGAERMILNLGEVLFDPFDPCLRHQCKLDSANSSIVRRYHTTCYEKCPPGMEYKKQDSTKCCGECITVGCKLENNIYGVGEHWKSDDNCTYYECSIQGGLYQISTYQKRCPDLPKNCPNDQLYTENCCQYCEMKEEHPKFMNELPKVNEDIKLDEYDYKSHPCVRTCIDGQAPKICSYTFVIEWYETLSKACYNCPYNLTDCDRLHCIGADGARRPITVVNRVMPGPTIEVCKGDNIVVDVKNNLLGESTTIHWHGLHQKINPFMDGVPHISQCPIHPHATFRYTFVADNPGTHFWHSHTGMQRGDGVFGPLIIKAPAERDPHSKLFDYDLIEHVMSLNDWAHEPGVSMFASHHHSNGDNKPPNLLINGKGRFYQRSQVLSTINVNSSNVTETNITTNNNNITQTKTTKLIMKETETTVTTSTETVETTGLSTILDSTTVSQQIINDLNITDPLVSIGRIKRNTVTKNPTSRERILIASEESKLMPLEVFHVEKGYRYRFRTINAGFLNCPIEVSIDSHKLTIISSDGFDIQPVEVESFVIYAGERFDFILNANHKIGNYWIRYRGLMDCDERFTSAHQVAILRYNSASTSEPEGLPTWDYVKPGLQLNSLNKGSGEKDSLTIAEVTSLEPNIEKLTAPETDYKFYIYYDFYEKSNPHFHLHPHYGFHQIQKNTSRVLTPQLNHITNKMPNLPLMIERDQLDELKFCNEDSLVASGVNCRETFCECSHVLQIQLNASVEIIIVDEGWAYDANHPFHLHGYGFLVVGMDRLGKNTTIEEIKALDKAGRLPRRLRGSPMKDTVTIPDGGYTIIRFLATNPGYWLLHCHIEFHAEIGMALVLKVGDHKDFVPVPKNFPRCHDYMPETQENKNFATLLSSSMLLLNLVLLSVVFL